MPNTGLLTATGQENSSAVFFEGNWINDGGFIVFAGTGTQTAIDFSTDTISGNVTGAEVHLFSHSGFNNASATLSIEISIDGGSSFSDAIASATFTNSSTSQTDDFVVGASNNLWGLDWSGFTDLADLQVKGTANGTNAVLADFIQLKVYYEASAAVDLRFTKLNSGKLTINSGTFTIK